jgi:hypothetical protein
MFDHVCEHSWIIKDDYVVYSTALPGKTERKESFAITYASALKYFVFKGAKIYLNPDSTVAQRNRGIEKLLQNNLRYKKYENDQEFTAFFACIVNTKGQLSNIGWIGRYPYDNRIEVACENSIKKLTVIHPAKVQNQEVNSLAILKIKVSWE